MLRVVIMKYLRMSWFIFFGGEQDIVMATTSVCPVLPMPLGGPGFLKKGKGWHG